MTKNIRTGVGIIASIVVLFAAAAWAHSARVFATPTAIAIVDLDVLQADLEEQKALSASLILKYKPMQVEIEQLKAEFEANRLKLEEEGATMTTDEYQELDIATVLLGQRRKNTEEIVAYAQNIEAHAIMQDIYPKIYKAINHIAERDGWDIVLLDTSKIDPTKTRDFEAMNRAVYSKHVLYANPNVDITRDVVTLLNDEFASGQTPPTPGTP